MKRMVLFGGTTEGRLLAEFCAEEGIPAVVSVATEYGAEVLPDEACLQIQVQRLSAEEMCVFLEQCQAGLVVDATHPYAVEVSEQIRRACEQTRLPLVRVVRPGGFAESAQADTGNGKKGQAQGADTEDPAGRQLQFATLDEILNYLEVHQGNVLITTGSKEAAAFCRLQQFADRCYLRVLDVPRMVAQCEALGFTGVHLISGRGPFSIEENVRHLRQAQAVYLVTKDSGKTGGFPEKAAAAGLCQVTLLVLQKPGEQGVSLEEAKEKVKQWYASQ